MNVASMLAEGATTAIFNIPAGTFDGLTTAITEMVPIILPTVVTVLGIRKGLSFMMSCIRGC